MTAPSNTTIPAYHSQSFGWVFPEPDAPQASSSSPPPKPVNAGRACLNCAKAKARCAGAVAEGGKCERCQRMNKDCQPAPVVRRKKAAKPISKTALLEEKLEGLVEYLKSTQPQTKSPTSPEDECSQTSGSVPTRPAPIDPLNINRLRCNEAVPSTHKPPPPNQTHHNQSSIPTPPYTWHSGPPSYTTTGPAPFLPRTLPSADAESCLRNFRTTVLKHLPFVSIAPTTTAAELAASRPFLWHAILTITLRSSRLQYAAAQEFRALVGRESFLEGRKDLDFLQGVLVYASWDQHHCFYKHIVGVLNGLCQAMVYDMGIIRPPPTRSHLVLLEYDERGCPKPPRSQIRTLEERRALLGTFLLSALSASFFSKGNPLPWTPYSEECCRVLSDTNDSPHDKMLVQLVRSALLVIRVFKAPWYDLSMVATGERSLTQASVYVRELERQLEEFREGIPAELRGNELLQLEIYSNAANIYEVALSKMPGLFDDEQEFKRLEYLDACFRNIKAWFALFLTMTPREYVGFPLNMIRQIGHSVILLYRLSTTDVSAAWDTSLVRSSMPIGYLIQEIENRLKDVKAAVGLDEGVEERIDSFWFLAEKIGKIRTWWDSRLESGSSAVAAAATGNAGANVSTGGGDVGSEGSSAGAGTGSDTRMGEATGQVNGVDAPGLRVGEVMMRDIPVETYMDDEWFPDLTGAFWEGGDGLGLSAGMGLWLGGDGGMGYFGFANQK